MHTYPETAGGIRRGACLALLGGILALELAVSSPADAAHADDSNAAAIVAQFRQICGELDAARAGLRAGTVSSPAFADEVLDLFVRADSLRQLVPHAGWTQGVQRAGGPLPALSRAFAFLIESLRENYAGITSGDGIRFVQADRAYQAAVAWRPDIGASAAPAAR